MPPTAAPAGTSAPAIDVTVVAVAEPVAHLLLRVSGTLDEGSLSGYFQRLGAVILDAKARRVLLDLRACSVRLSIADMHGLVKMIAGQFAGVVDKLAVVMAPSDILPEKFFEPALTSRGVPTLATASFDDAVDWLAAKLRPGR